MRNYHDFSAEVAENAKFCDNLGHETSISERAEGMYVYGISCPPELSFSLMLAFIVVVLAT